MSKPTIFTPTTWKWIAYTVVAFVLIFIGLALAGWGKKLFSKGGGASGSNGNNADGTPVIPSTVDESYIERIATLALRVHSTQDYKWLSSDRCEVCNNIFLMRTDELVALVNMCKSGKKFDLKQDVNKYSGVGCLWGFSKGSLSEVQDKLKNY